MAVSPHFCQDTILSFPLTFDTQMGIMQYFMVNLISMSVITGNLEHVINLLEFFSLSVSYLLMYFVHFTIGFLKFFFLLIYRSRFPRELSFANILFHSIGLVLTSSVVFLGQISLILL